MKPNMKWYVKSNSGNAVGGPYLSEEIADQHIISLDAEYGPHLTTDCVDINELEPVVRHIMKNADVKALRSGLNRKTRRAIEKRKRLKRNKLTKAMNKQRR